MKPIDGRISDRRALAFILITVMLDAMGIGLLVPVIPRLILQLTGQGLVYAAIYGGWLTATFATVQFMAGPILGSLSDRFGRRPVLLLSLAAFGVSYLLMAFAPSIHWLFAAQAITGLFGATPATAGAYIADISQAERRTQRFGYMAGAFGTGLILGPALGGLLVGYGLSVPFFAAATLSLVTVAYGAWVLPESLPVDLRRPLSFARANPVGAMLELNRVGGVGLLLAAVFFQRVATSTIPATWPYFTMQEYGWTPQTVGYSLAAYGASAVVIQAGLLRWIAAQIGTRGAAALALAMLVMGFVGFAFGRGPWIVATCVPLTAMGFMAGPALTSLLSADIAGDAQGTLQGVLASINGVAAVLTPLAMPWLFSVFSSNAAGIRFPGAPYILAAALALVGLSLVLRAKSKQPEGIAARKYAS